MNLTLEALNKRLKEAGKSTGNLYLAILGLAILLGFPIACAIGLLYLGGFIAGLVGGGTLGAIIFFAFPFFVCLFFSIYAWPDHVGPAVGAILDILNKAVR